MDFPPYNTGIIIYKSNEPLDKFWRNKAGETILKKLMTIIIMREIILKKLMVKIKVKEIIRKFLMEKIMAKGIILTKMLL